MKIDYTRADLADALSDCGLKRGDVVLSHSNVGYFGIPEGGRKPEAVFSAVYGAIRHVIGEEGTLVVPTFTYSFPRGETFDVRKTPSSCGLLTEMVRNLPEALRSRDPIFSVAAVGPKADHLTQNTPIECFGPDSFWARFLQIDGVICNLNFDAGSTFVHYVEKCIGVPYRYDKLFLGTFVDGNKSSPGAALSSVQDLSNRSSVAKFERFDRLAREKGVLRTGKVGRGSVVVIKANDSFALIKEEIGYHPRFLTVCEEPAMVKSESSCPLQLKTTSSNPLNTNFMESAWKVKRHLLSCGGDAILDALADEFPVRIHQYPTGTRAGGYVIPERWDVGDSSILALDGRLIASSEDGTLLPVTYSKSIDREVTREELLQHIYANSDVPNAIPYCESMYMSDWGMCTRQSMVDVLLDESYHIKINSKFSFGNMRIGEIIAQGEEETSILIVAQIGHTNQFNHGFSGLVGAVELMDRLHDRSNLRYTYRVLVVPGIMGYYAYLANRTASDSPLLGALFLDVLATDAPYYLRYRAGEETPVGEKFKRAFAMATSHGRLGRLGHSSSLGCDDRPPLPTEVRYDLPAMLLSRQSPFSQDDLPFPSYHSDHDRPSAKGFVHIIEASNMIYDFVAAFETLA